MRGEMIVWIVILSLVLAAAVAQGVSNKRSTGRWFP